MTNDDLIAKAKTLDAGAEFRRCSFQVNPCHYRETFRGQQSNSNAETHAATIIEKAVELGISVLAITDHNHVGSVPLFRTAAEDHDVVVFPGFELSTHEGVHILCIYPPDTSQDQLSRYLGAFGITMTTPSTQLSECNFKDALRMVRKQGGISIAAHVSNEKGLLTVLSGQSRIEAWRNDELLAVQIPGTIGDLPHKYRRIIENKDPQYRRDNPAADNQAVAVINAKDVVTPEDLEEASASCWIKMSEPSVEGLRQAFLDPGSRVRLNKPGPAEHAEVVAIAWEGGFLDGAAIRFNHNLNVLVGGRGEGKSTIIESLRYVLNLEPLGEEAEKAHNGIVKQVLRSGTKISILIRTHRPSLCEYRVDRTVPNPPRVVDENGNVTKLAPQDILPDIEIYGQHEISELTKSREKLTRLLDRFVERDDSVSDRRVSILQGLKSSRQDLLNADSELDEIRRKLEELPQLEERMVRFNEAGVEERLKDQTQLLREEQILKEVPGRLTETRGCLTTLRVVAESDQALIDPEVLSDLPGREILEPLNTAFDRFQLDITKTASDLEGALFRFDESVNDVQDRWDRRKKEVDAEYDAILREFQGTKVDGEEYMRLNRRVEALKPLRGRAQELEEKRRALADKRRKQLAEWEDFKAERFRRLDRATKRVNRKLRSRVQVEVTSAGNREPLFSLLKEKVGGRLTETIEALRNKPDLSLTEFVAACREGAAALRSTYGITPMQADSLADMGFEILLAIEELELHPITTIMLNTAAEEETPSWQKLEDLSTGQKATAVLLLLLLDSDSPLIVDQPEDDLDNRFITDGIVPRMREEKQQRQFIFSTHNANIPVLGDAELIIGLSAAGEAGSDDGRARIASEQTGSIDSLAVRELVEDILEGGKEAFERRRRKYGF